MAREFLITEAELELRDRDAKKAGFGDGFGWGFITGSLTAILMLWLYVTGFFS